MLPGADILLTGRAQGTPVLQYRWQKDGTDLNNATNASLVLTNLTLNDIGTYRLMASNRGGINVSREAHLTLAPARLPLSGLVAYYPFEGSALDFSGRGNHGILSNNPAFVSGYSASSLRVVAATSNLVLVPSSPDLQMRYTHEKTISVWVNAQGFPYDGHTIVAKYTLYGVFDSEYAIYVLPSGLVRVQGHGGNFLDAGHISLHEWNHVAVVMKYGPGNSKIYVNGALAGAGEVGYTDRVLDVPLRFGHFNGETARFHGMIDEVRIYNRVLTEPEIQILATRFAPPGLPPQLEWLHRDRDIVLSWPTHPTGFYLESADSPISAIWSRVPFSSVTANDYWTTNFVSATNSYYRLKK